MKGRVIQNHQVGFKILMFSTAIFLSACQPKGELEQKDNKTSQYSSSSPAETNTWITSKTIALKIPKSKVCDTDGCTQFDLQTVETNYAWINAYFIERIKKTVPLAFQAENNSATSKSLATTPKSSATSKLIDEKNLGESSVVIRFVGQNQNLATFEMLSYSYNAGAAHGMYHKEYVNFDLKSKKRIALKDLIVSGSEAKLIEAIYQNNLNWLADHSIEQTKLQLSDNFYYGANGIVFVYPFYELASYAEGMPELTLAYHSTAGLIQAKYLPALPKYKTD